MIKIFVIAVKGFKPLVIETKTLPHHQQDTGDRSLNSFHFRPQ